MADYSADVAILSAAYDRLTDAKTVITAKIRNEYREKMREAIAEAIKTAEQDFASEIAKATARGVPGAIIREHVLHTQDWSRWKKWRDLAQIEPERVMLARTREETHKANRGFRWEEDPTAEIGWVFVLDRDEKGNPVPEIRIDSWIVKDDRLMAFPNNDDETRAYAGRYFGDLRGLARFVTRLATETREEIGR